MTALVLALVLAQTSTGEAVAASQPAAASRPATARAHVVYQKSADVHRVYITVPASTQGWVRTGLDPVALAGRPVAIAWTASVAHDDPAESLDAFKQRLSRISLRQARQRRVGPVAAPAALPPAEVCARVAADRAVSLPVQEPVCFAAEPGALELRFDGARAADRGHYRVFFACEAGSEADSIVDDGVADTVQLFEAGQPLTAPPPLAAP